MLYVAWKRESSWKICTFCPVSSNQKAFVKSLVFWILRLIYCYSLRVWARNCLPFAQEFGRLLVILLNIKHSLRHCHKLSTLFKTNKNEKKRKKKKKLFFFGQYKTCFVVSNLRCFPMMQALMSDFCLCNHLFIYFASCTGVRPVSYTHLTLPTRRTV